MSCEFNYALGRLFFYAAEHGLSMFVCGVLLGYVARLYVSRRAGGRS